MTEHIPPLLLRILLETRGLERAYLVGGSVRDWLLNEPVVDFDVEVYGMDFPSLCNALQRWGRIDLVGVSFGVAKLKVATGQTFDFALPRRDSKKAPGHQGFDVACDPDLPLHEAAARRDFTLNALFWDPRTQNILDFHGGLDDLKAGRLHPTSIAFSEDPLRVLRGMQFVSRFNLQPTPTLIDMCRSIAHTHDELAVERIREEWWKWACKSRRPSAGMRFLEATNWLQHYPQLDRLRRVPQDPEWHPEGDVWIHTLHCLDALVALPQWRELPEKARGILAFAVLLHDIGKPDCTLQQERDGRLRWLSPGHDAAALPLAESFFERLSFPKDLRPHILALVAQHMAHLEAPSPRAIRRLARRLFPATIDELAIVMTADASGRPPLPPRVPEAVLAILTRASELDVLDNAPQPILLGRHLLARGMERGPAMGTLLKAAFEAQLDGAFSDLDGAHHWLDTHQN